MHLLYLTKLSGRSLDFNFLVGTHLNIYLHINKCIWPCHLQDDGPLCVNYVGFFSNIVTVQFNMTLHHTALHCLRQHIHRSINRHGLPLIGAHAQRWRNHMDRLSLSWPSLLASRPKGLQMSHFWSFLCCYPELPVVGFLRRLRNASYHAK